MGATSLRVFLLVCVIVLLLVLYLILDQDWTDSCTPAPGEWITRLCCYVLPLVKWRGVLPKMRMGAHALAAVTADGVTTQVTATVWDPDLRENVSATVTEWLKSKGKGRDHDEDYRTEVNAFSANCGLSLRRVAVEDQTLKSIFRFDLPVLLWSDHITAGEFERLSKYRAPYGWSGMNWTDMEETKKALGRPEHRRMFDAATRVRGETACVRCAVVGNGGILHTSGKGKEIDAHDYVFRVNGAVTARFEDDVGTRTSFYFFSTNTLKNSMLAYNRFGFKHAPWSEETRYVFVPCGHQDYYMVTAAVKGVPVSKGPNINQSPSMYFGDKNVEKKVKMLHPDFLRYLKNNFLPSTILQTRYKNIYRPSTGAIALLTALHTCDQVSAYGFITSNYNHFPDHYFDPVQKLIFYVNHDMNFERKLWKMLRKLKVMTLYQRRTTKD